MKVIDLLLKIANGEELPKKIKFESSKTIYELNDYTQRYIGEYLNNILILEHIDIESLNKEVEIIEDIPKEDKKIDRVSLLDVKTDYKLKKLKEENKKLNEHKRDYDLFIERHNKLFKDYKELEEENKRLSKNQRYYKNGVFCLEYDKETMSDMIDAYKSRIDKAIEYIDNIYNNKDYIDDLYMYDLLKILKGEEK